MAKSKEKQFEDSISLESYQTVGDVLAILTAIRRLNLERLIDPSDSFFRRVAVGLVVAKIRDSSHGEWSLSQVGRGTTLFRDLDIMPPTPEDMRLVREWLEPKSSQITEIISSHSLAQRPPFKRFLAYEALREYEPRYYFVHDSHEGLPVMDLLAYFTEWHMRLVWNPILSNYFEKMKEEKALKGKGLKGKAETPEAAETAETDTETGQKGQASVRQRNRISERRFEGILDELKEHYETVTRFKGMGIGGEDFIKKYRPKLTKRQQIALDLLNEIEPFDASL
jgi:hypothetical protein